MGPIIHDPSIHFAAEAAAGWLSRQPGGCPISSVSRAHRRGTGGTFPSLRATRKHRGIIPRLKECISISLNLVRKLIRLRRQALPKDTDTDIEELK
jgi:hypothetical protein